MKPCVLHVRDEVNCKFEGLDVSTRRKLTKLFSYEIPYARYLPAVKLGRWDGRMAFFTLGGSSYVNLLDKILPEVTRLGYDVSLEDHREYETNYEFTPVTETSYSDRTWPKTHPQAGEANRTRLR